MSSVSCFFQRGTVLAYIFHWFPISTHMPLFIVFNTLMVKSIWCIDDFTFFDLTYQKHAVFHCFGHITFHCLNKHTFFIVLTAILGVSRLLRALMISVWLIITPVYNSFICEKNIVCLLGRAVLMLYNFYCTWHGKASSQYIIASGLCICQRLKHNALSSVNSHT